ncbi:MAG: hypothetical protein R3B70_19815 [Polyangiaceae bacterium]
MIRTPKVRAAKLALLAASLAAFAGCNAPSAEDVCKRIATLDCPEWSGERLCTKDGEALQDRVDAAGTCDDAWSEYRQCLWDSKSCDFAGACPSERADLVACIGPL